MVLANHMPNYTTPHDIRVFQREDNDAEESHGLEGRRRQTREEKDGRAGLRVAGRRSGTQASVLSGTPDAEYVYSHVKEEKEMHSASRQISWQDTAAARIRRQPRYNSHPSKQECI